MDKNLMNISKIESFMNSLIDNKVSNNTFFTDLPPTINASWTDMVVVDCNTIYDKGGIASGTVNILLYAKPLSNGNKNVAKLSELEVKLNKCLENNTSKTYIITRVENMPPDYDEDRNLHCNAVKVNLIIV